MQKDKQMAFRKWDPKYGLLFLMVLSVGLMLWLKSDIFVIFSAIFTFLYFGLWIKGNIRAFLNWIQRAKGDFAILGEYADRFTDMFSKNREGKR